MATTSNTLSGVTFNEFELSSSGAIDANGDGSVDFQDNTIELFNTSGSPVDVSGWEVWLVSNNANGALQVATIDASSTVSASDHLTLVENSASAVNTSNVPGDAQFIDVSGAVLNAGTETSWGLYDPGSNQFIVVKAQNAAASETTLVAAIQSAHSGATQSGSTETYTNTFTGGESAARTSDGDEVWTTGAATVGTPNCFLQGTLIATPSGEVPIETLKTGDLVTTSDGADIPVKWIARQTVVSRFGPAERLQPVRIAAGALGADMPHRDLTVTADHAIFIDGVLCNAGALVNATTITRVPLAEMGKRYTVYHIETDRHDIVLANGVPSETFLDTVSRRAFDNYAEYTALYGEPTEMVELPYPRALSARQVPAAIRRALATAKTA